MAKRRNSKAGIMFGVLIAAIILIAARQGHAQAQTVAANPANNLFIDWSTNTYVPAGYSGKDLPIAGSTINAWVALFEDGQSVNLSGYTIRWYAGSDLLQSGQGITSVSFQAPGPTGQIMNLQARVQSPAGDLSVANIQVPVINPVVAVAGDYPGNTVTGSAINLEALPYFFNVSDPSTLSFAWTVNGVSPQTSGNPANLAINLQGAFVSGSQIDTELSVTNPSDSTTATAHAMLTYQKS